MLYDDNETEILLAFRLMVVTNDLVELGMPSTDLRTRLSAL